MHKIVLIVCMLFSLPAFCRKIANVEYNCRFEWQTLTEALISKDKVFRDITNVKINEKLDVELDLQEESSKLQVIEHFGDDNSKNYLKYTFVCNRYLSCKGNRVNIFKGVTEDTRIDIGPNNHAGIGTIGGRDVFIYQPRPKDAFDFQYIIYKNQNGKPMGLKISCRKAS